MKNLNEIRIAAFRVIENIIILKANVFNGCYADKAELEKQMLRLESIKKWAVENNQLTEIKHFFASKKFGNNSQFAASEISTFFYK